MGIDEASNREAIAPPRPTRRCSRAWAATRTRPTGFDERAAAADRGAGGARARASRSARRGSTTTATARRATSSGPPSRRRSRSRARTGLPLVIHMRDVGCEDTFDVRDAARGRGRDRDPALLLGPAGAGRGGGRARLVLLVRRQPHLSRRPSRCARRRGSCPRELLLVETDSPFLAPQPVRGKPNQPANVVETARRLADERGIPYEELERGRGGERGEGVRVVRRRLGQHFLADPNLLDAIVRDSGVGARRRGAGGGRRGGGAHRTARADGRPPARDRARPAPAGRSSRPRWPAQPDVEVDVGRRDASRPDARSSRRRRRWSRTSPTRSPRR